MSGVVLAVVEHQAVVRQTLAAAQNLAGLMGSARINVLAIRVPPDPANMPTEEILTRHQATDFQAHEQARVAALHAVFEVWAATTRAPGITIEWIEIEGLADSLVAEWGKRSDFLVLHRPGAHDNAADRLKLQAALFDTDRPVLLVPPGPVATFGERVAIAWRDDKRTVRAVLAALRLLSKAQQVHVLTGAREGAPAPDLPEILAEHGIAATLHILPVGGRVFGEKLLAKAHALGADMLVTGAYTHNPWREVILGGVTRHMLAHADLPVLMRH